MLLKFAKSNQPATVILIPLIGLVLWYNPFFLHQNISEPALSAMPLYGFLLKSLQFSPFLTKFFGFVLFLSISLYLNHLNTKYIFISERTYLPSIFYIIICSLVSRNVTLFSALPAALFLLFAIERIFDSYKDEKLSYNVLDAGLLLGIASLFYFKIIFFVIFFWSVLLVIRKFYWREWLYVVLGVLVPYLLLLSLYYLFNKDNKVIFHAIKDNFTVYSHINLSKMQNISVSYLLLLLLLSSQYIIHIFSSKKIFQRKSYNLFLIAFLICVAIYFFIPSASLDLIYISAIPITFLFSNYFTRSRKSRWIVFLFDLLILMLILTQIFKF